jgi:hypothetical protein
MSIFARDQRVLSVDLVTADGAVRHVTPDSEPEGPARTSTT